MEGTLRTPRYSFEILPTPGHSDDHVCLVEPTERWVFGGDLFVHERVRYARRDEDLRLEILALQAVLARDPEVLFCGHSGIVPGAAEALRRKLRYWRGLAREAQRRRAAGERPRAIQRGLVGREGVMRVLTGGHFSKRAFIDALLGLPADVLED